MQITLSRNELKALLARTFEALYGHNRDYYDMAQAVLWLECCGHGGVAGLIDALPYLEQEGLTQPSLSERSQGHFIMDGGGHSLFCLARSICDLTMSAAAEFGAARLDVINTQNSKALIGVLKSAARPNHPEIGFAAVVISGWGIARIKAGLEFPIIYEIQNGSSDIVSFLCAKTDAVLDEYAPEYGLALTDVDIQKTAYEASLERGVTIDRSDYDVLTSIANRVLVEATEASRKGAGE